MSLLLEALKKAEKAKEEAQRQARGDAPADDGAAAASVDAAAAPVRTRDQLLDINQPLEIVADEPPPRPRPALALQEDKREEKREEKPRPAAAPRAQAQAAPAEAKASERAAARKVFEAKFKEPNPRLPFYITCGALGVFAIGTAVYFWIQLRPA